MSKHKYKVGDRFNFDGLVTIQSLVYSNNNDAEPRYDVLMQNGEHLIVDEMLIDAGVEHFSQKGYQVVYVAEAPTKQSADALGTQIGGSHYKNMAIQPVEFCMANNLNFCVSSAIKYLCRYKNKNGKQDLEKARHFIDLLIELEYSEDNFENVK